MRSSLIQKLKPKAVEFLQKSGMAAGVGHVARYLGVSWSTARQILMELLVEGEVEREKTANAMIFRQKGDERN